MDWLIELPQAMESELRKRIETLGKEKRMPYLAWIEREAHREGLQKGIKQGQELEIMSSIELALKLRFGRAGMALVPRVRKLEDLRKLKALQRAVFKATGIEQVTHLLRRKVAGRPTSKARG